MLVLYYIYFIFILYLSNIYLSIYLSKESIDVFFFHSKTSPMKGYEGTEAIIEAELKRLP